MTYEDYIAKYDEAAKELERITREIFKSADALRESALAFLWDYYRDNPNAKAAEILILFQDRFHLPKQMTDRLNTELTTAEQHLAAMKTAIIGEASGVDLSGINYSRLAAAYAINWPDLQNETLNAVTNFITRRVLLGIDVDSIVQDLRKSEILAYQAKTMAYTGLAGFDNEITFHTSTLTGVKRFDYAGPPAQRAFCVSHLGNTYTLDEIGKMSNGQGLSVRTNCGGYNCRHKWLPHFDDLVGRR